MRDYHLFKFSQVKIILIIFLLTLFTFLSSSASHAITYLKAIRSWTAPDYTRIVFDLDNQLFFEDNTREDSSEINIRFKGCKNLMANRVEKIDSPQVNKLEVIESPPDSLIVKVSLPKIASYSIFPLRKYRDKPDRVVIDIKNPDYEKEEKRNTNVINKLKQTNWIVLIDPGHGGEDPGAIGKRRYCEKDIVLSVCKQLCDLLNEQDYIKAYLTRRGDYFLSLRERIDIAHKYHADIFISVHANACSKRRKRGASVYFLSRDGATDEAAGLLAEQENASDKIGGIALGRDKILDSILIDLAQTHTINESIDLGGKILNGLTSINVLEREGLKCANFTVLKSPSIPSVLVELAYISNTNDLDLLISKKYQMQMARKISEGISKYFSTRPPKEMPENIFAETSVENRDYKIHIVQKGETLWRISTLYGIPLDRLRQFNGLKVVSKIMVGQKLKIPGINN